MKNTQAFASELKHRIRMFAASIPAGAIFGIGAAWWIFESYYAKSIHKIPADKIAEVLAAKTISTWGFIGKINFFNESRESAAGYWGRVGHLDFIPPAVADLQLFLIVGAAIGAAVGAGLVAWSIFNSGGDEI